MKEKKEQVIAILQRLFWKLRASVVRDMTVQDPEFITYDPQTVLLGILQEIFEQYHAQISLVLLQGLKNDVFQIEFQYKHTYIKYILVYVPTRDRFVYEASTSGVSGIHLLLGRITPKREEKMKKRIRLKLEQKLKGTRNEFRFLGILKQVLRKESFNFVYEIDWSNNLDQSNIDFFLRRQDWRTGIKFQIKSSLFFLHKNKLKDDVYIIFVNERVSSQDIKNQITRIIRDFEHKTLYSFV